MKNGKYELVVAPSWYRGKKYRGRYVYKHRLVAAEKIGRPLTRKEVAHHQNEVKTDNRSENIEVKSLSSHARDHQSRKEIKKLACSSCLAEFEVEARRWREKIKKGQNRFFCSRACGTTAPTMRGG